MDTACPDAAKSGIDEIPEITLRNVSFQYGDQVILQDINYSFHAGCKYAVMGESGSGKTTLTKVCFLVILETFDMVRWSRNIFAWRTCIVI